MVPPHHLRSKLVLVLGCVIALVLAMVAPAATAAEPTPPPPNETGTPTLATLRSNLETAGREYIAAEEKLNLSKARQAEQQTILQQTEAEVAQLKQSFAKYAGEAYKTGRVGVIGAMLNASSPDNFLQRAEALDRMTQRDQGGLERLMAAKYKATATKSNIDQEVAEQAAQTAEMAKRKLAAEKALAAVGGGQRTNVNTTGAATAKPAPRNPDGSWPKESCSISDPTPADGCITPRTNHALNEGKAAGFNWYVSCYRSGGDGEHPKGRACDWAAFPGGFENRSAGGSNRDYGDRLAAFFVKNASALAVMYVVWYCRIWHVGTGWRTYNSAGSNCGDDPAGDHTNHVHTSIY
jgi:hypothetical protein